MMKHHKSLATSILALAGGLMLMGTVAASAGGHQSPVSFSELDSDGNGMVTRDELMAQQEIRFNELDTDGDGMISEEELKAEANSRAQGRVEQVFNNADTDGDGSLSQEEFETLVANRDRSPDDIIARLDTNGDGQISQDEYNQAVANRPKPPRAGALRGNN